MSGARSRGAEEARNQFSDLLEAAENGDSTIITRHDRPVAALVPIDRVEWDLTPREWDVVRLIARGHTVRQVSVLLAVSLPTVRTYLSRILAKTGFRKTADIMAAYPLPADRIGQSGQQQSLVPLKGTGRGLWGRSSTRTLRKLRDEWNR